MDIKYFPSKILLFGEYTVITGSEALAIPYQKFKSRWKFKEKKEIELFKPYLQYLYSVNWKKLKTEFYRNKLENDIEKGLYLDSNIPVGYGVGSSGSLSAAIFHEYFNKSDLSLLQIKNILTKIENFFHGRSSGFDPLVSYLNKAIRISKKNKFKIIYSYKMNFIDFDFFLLDSERSRETKKYVERYDQKLKDISFKDHVVGELCELNNNIIEYFIAGKQDKTFTLFKEISKLEYKYFNEMIPENINQLWEESLNSNNLAIKLCGAGGGGFFLAMKKNNKIFGETFDKFKIQKI